MNKYSIIYIIKKINYLTKFLFIEIEQKKNALVNYQPLLYRAITIYYLFIF